MEPAEGKITIMGIFLGLTTAYCVITSWCPTCYIKTTNSSRHGKLIFETVFIMLETCS